MDQLAAGTFDTAYLEDGNAQIAAIPGPAANGQIDPKRPVTSNALDSWVRSDHHLTQPVGASMDIGAWLRGLGLGQYEAAFRESEIEADVLPELTETDLEKIGLPLGPRKRILKAITHLVGAERALGEGSLSGPPPAGDAADRRQLTVMFCDLVGSTALSTTPNSLAAPPKPAPVGRCP